ncbi:uncharacterized protein SAPINGB_P004030 [Magnusiomyces paraingens]|uniref:ABC transporter domain-containing protein n=1 Tax=Magnusiomyces paraingens TaxID=2606893 RepID=A0A5E8BXV4_9ASCO|nr:uncharacterized protein SAPINGB_P004030 [Saprochaete ingens]VVT54347.1 unnamed protein product [Saprochaete ingens]
MAQSLSTLWWTRYNLFRDILVAILKNPSLLKSTIQTHIPCNTRRRYRNSLILSLILISGGIYTMAYYRRRRRAGLSGKQQQEELEKPGSGSSDEQDEISKNHHRRRSSFFPFKDTFTDQYEIMVPYKNGQTKVVITPTRMTTFQAHRRLFFDPVANSLKISTGVNRKFFRQFLAIWSIIVPRVNSKSSVLLMVHTFFLFLRTWLSLVVAKLDGQIVRDLIAANGRGFARGLVYWLLIAIPASYTNAMIKFLQAKISIDFRTRLVRYIHDIYLDDNLGFYKVNNIDGGVQGVDQYITADLTKFCDSAASLYSSLGKPSVDFFIFSYQLSRNLGPLAIFGIFGNYFTTAWLLKSMAPPFGKLTAVEAKLEGEYRNAHSRIITNAEEIAFYDGTELERSILIKTYSRLVAHIRAILRIKVSYNMFEDFVLKYSWSAIGYLFASLPVFMPNWSGQSVIDESRLVNTPSQAVTANVSATIATAAASQGNSGREKDRMRQFITNKRLMLSLADAGGRMMYSIKDLAELAGYTSRVFTLLATLHRVQAKAYGKSAKDKTTGKNTRHRVALYSLEDVRGTMQEGYNGVRFEHTPIVVPGLGRDLSPGELLVQDLNIVINPGEHLLISGPNGSGKSAVARVLGGLWPVFRGLVSKPVAADIAFIPQRPYLTVGTLREQVSYPYTSADLEEMGVTDAHLEKILEEVKLEYLVSREGGWDVHKPWKDVFSGGEKQRVMFARVLLKQPKFAVIDEGTSAVSSDVEGILYETCQRAGITLITISHRPSLLRYHGAQLRLGLGENGDEWELEKTNTEAARLSVEREIAELESKLGRVEEWKARRQEIINELSGK